MNHCTDRNILQRKSITNFGSSFRSGHQFAADFKSIRSNDITFFSISIIQQRNTSRAIRIIFNCFYDCWNSIFLSFEINKTEFSLVATAQITHSPLTDIVTTTGRTFTIHKRFFWYRCSNFFKCTNNFVSLTRSCGSKFPYCHYSLDITIKIYCFAFAQSNDRLLKGIRTTFN